jgi:hypothetical protein
MSSYSYLASSLVNPGEGFIGTIHIDVTHRRLLRLFD